MERLLIVDGSNLLFQMFFGMPARIVNKQGKAIQGTLGFTGALLRIIRMVMPTHAAVLFDGEHENPRAALDAGYKANRPDYSKAAEGESPFSQIGDVYAALDFLGIKRAETTVCEADDWIAGYALSLAAGSEMVISSFDSDFFQLINERVSVLRYRGKKTVVCTSEFIREKYGIEPGQYADFKSLTGDTADNIRGAEKIGMKTAACLLNEFGTLENILLNAGTIAKPSVRESILHNVERLRKNYQMIRLTGAGELPFGMEELNYTDGGKKTNEVLKGIGLM